MVETNISIAFYSYIEDDAASIKSGLSLSILSGSIRDVTGKQNIGSKNILKPKKARKPVEIPEENSIIYNDEVDNYV